jgi:hypothetical protein
VASLPVILRSSKFTHSTCAKSPTRRQSQRPWLSRLVLRAARAAPATVVAHLERSAKESRMRHWYSTIGLILGFVAVAIAAFESHLVASAPKEDKRSLRELATEAGKKLLKEKVLKEEAPPPPPKPFHPVKITYTVLGLAAIGFGAFSWIKKEHVRMSGGAVALGLLAVCWQWVLIGVCIAVVIFLLAQF